LSEIDDTASPHVIHTVIVKHFPFSMALDGSHVWVTNQYGNAVTEVDVASHSMVATVTVGSNPYGVAFDGTHIWVANQGRGTVSVL
jgi:YVTN family beta-propeller protein